MQGNQVRRERLEQLLQDPATLEACVEVLHRGRWAGLCRECCSPASIISKWPGRPIPKEACVGAMDAWRAVSPCIWPWSVTANCVCVKEFSSWKAFHAQKNRQVVCRKSPALFQMVYRKERSESVARSAACCRCWCLQVAGTRPTNRTLVVRKLASAAWPVTTALSSKTRCHQPALCEPICSSF